MCEQGSEGESERVNRQGGEEGDLLVINRDSPISVTSQSIAYNSWIREQSTVENISILRAVKVKEKKLKLASRRNCR